MAIQVYRTPQRRDDELEFSVAGEVLTINGEDIDLSGVGSQCQIIDNPFITGFVFRKGGDVHVNLVRPFGQGEDPGVADEMPTCDPQVNLQQPTPRLTATALLTVDSGDLGGVSSAAGLSFGLYMGVGLYWLFFSNEMDDLSYSYAVAASQGRVTVTDRQLSYMELTVVDDAGNPLDPTEISLQLYRSN